MVPTTGTAQARMLNVPSGKYLHRQGQPYRLHFRRAVGLLPCGRLEWRICNGWDVHLFRSRRGAQQVRQLRRDHGLARYLSTFLTSTSMSGCLMPAPVNPRRSSWDRKDGRFGFLENDTSGTLNAFPFALYDREGGAITTRTRSNLSPS